MPLLPDDIEELKRVFGEISRVDLDGRTLLRVGSAPLPRGCSPKAHTHSPDLRGRSATAPDPCEHGDSGA